ncbi:MAG: hypothetical protein IKI95_06040 [Clostridia bacterium]|nr:hypothetical protein [Clostridia bacterium]
MSTTIVQLKNNRILIHRYPRSLMWTLTTAVNLGLDNNCLKKEDIPDTIDLIDKFYISPIKKTHDFREQKRRIKAINKFKNRQLE